MTTLKAILSAKIRKNEQITKLYAYFFIFYPLSLLDWYGKAKGRAFSKDGFHHCIATVLPSKVLT
jgi:hypothetical protein